MKRWLLLSLLALVLLLTACSLSDDVTPPPALATAQAVQPGQVATSDTVGMPPVAPAAGQLQPPETSPDLVSGEAIYIEKCLPCHGPQGLGDGDMAANLDSPPPALGNLQVARQAVPAEWYTVVTQGRMEQFMPPFSSLSDQERWDATGYLLSLGLAGEDLDGGEDLFAANCAECHLGQNPVGGSLVDPTFLAQISRQSIYDTIEDGGQDMPSFGGQFSPDEIWSLAAYVQTLNIESRAAAVSEPTGTLPSEAEATAQETQTVDQTEQGTPAAEGTEQAAPTGEAVEPTVASTETVIGSISGTVVQGTSGAEVPQGLTAQLLGIEGSDVVIDEETDVAQDGTFSFENLESVPGRVYAVVVEYQGVPYFSEGAHLLADEPQIELPVVIHETTTDTDQLLINRVHLIADPSTAGQVIVTELWLVTNVGDRTIFNPEGGASFEATLPEGFTDLEFFDESAQLRYQTTDTGFVYTGSLVPGFENEIVFSFALEFDNHLDFEQPMDFPVGAVVALVPEGSLTISGDDVVDRGVQDMGGTALQTYNLPALESGEAISFRLEGGSGSAEGTQNTGLIVGLAALGAGLIGAGLLWYRQSQAQDEPESEPEPPAKPKAALIKRDQLLKQIADLDDAHEAGEIDRASYEKRRQRLKDEVRRLMQDQG